MSASRRQYAASSSVTETATAEASPRRHITSRKSFKHYAARHLQACLLSLGQMVREPISASMILLVIGVALAFPVGLFVLLKNVQHLSHGWDEGSQISLYLKMDTTPEEARNLMASLKKHADVAKVTYVSPQHGLEEFQKQSDYGEALSMLKENPLPGVLLVTPASDLQTPEAMNQLITTLKKMPAVEVAQLDMEWVKRLYALLNLGKHLVLALACLFGLGVILIIGNTIHLATQNHREEIEVYQLVGATNAFIRRPFLYTGILYGLFGGAIAWLLVYIVLWSLKSPTDTLIKLYGSYFQLSGLGLGSSITLLVTAMLLGWLGSWGAVSRHLSENNI